MKDAEALRQAFSSLAVRARARPDCPDPGLFWAALRGELPARGRRALVEHTADCPACGEAWRLARELGAELQGDPAARGWLNWLRSLARALSSWRSLSLAAAAAGVLIAVISVQRRPVASPGVEPPAMPVLRAPVPQTSPDQALPMVRSLLPAPSVLPRDRLLLRWAPGPQGSRYRVTVTTESLDLVLAMTNLEVAEFLVPQARVKELPAGAKLFWQVEAQLPDGSRVRSETFVLAIQ